MEEQIRELFIQGYDCGQVVLAHFAERFHLTKEQAYKIAAGFGGGMFCGETCGTVTGGIMAIGLKYGNTKPGEIEKKQIMTKKGLEFQKQFREKRGSCLCKDLLGYDISVPGVLDEVIESGLLLARCPKIAEDSIQILEDILGE